MEDGGTDWVGLVESAQPMLTFIGALAAVWLGGWLNRSSDDRRWRRESRLRVYLDALKTVRETIGADDAFLKQCHQVGRFESRGARPESIDHQIRMLDDLHDEWVMTHRRALAAADEVGISGSGQVARILDRVLAIERQRLVDNYPEGEETYADAAGRIGHEAALRERDEVWMELVRRIREELGLSD